MRAIPLLALPALLLACAPTPKTPIELPMMGGYRDAADQCRRVGESDYTNRFLGDASDLVACPAEYEGVGVFVTETRAIEVDRVGGFILYTVPRR
ncbi:hypothetical protein [Tropicimonas sp. IMCC34043]|uniref:hypothetical protein n=1 Tax=Tropicimonas sp. IMCC34043 TaxID=2248760 RepID=UPI0018E5247A|nr:hypothetical protein [Tropicimonas sp. IMCC34043]